MIFVAQHTDYARANAGIARRDPERFFCFACVHASRDAGRICEMVGLAVQRWGFRGIKVHRAEAPTTREIAETARVRLPVLYDITGEVYYIKMIAAEYPEVNFIIPYLGSFADDWRAHRQVINQLVRLPNVYADTSGVKRFDYVVEAVKRAGAHKLLFGSDGPWLHPTLELQKIRLLGLLPEQEAPVLAGNLARLIRHVAALRREQGQPAAEHFV